MDKHPGTNEANEERARPGTRLARLAAMAVSVAAASACADSKGEAEAQASPEAAARAPASPSETGLDPDIPPTFEGRALLVLSDTDMLASAFVDGVLQVAGRTAGGARDALTTLALPLHVAVPLSSQVVSGEAPVENSVIGPPYGIAVSPDGRRAYVLRTRGSPPEGVTRVGSVFTDLPVEAMVSVVDLTNLAEPSVTQQVAVGRLAHTLSLSPDGKLLAINSDEPGRNILLREVLPDGTVGREVAALGIEVDGKPLRRVGRVEWHPSGRFLANGLSYQDEIRFLELVRGGDTFELRPWGSPVEVGKFPDEGAFTPDGRFYLTTDLQWGDDVPGVFVDPPPGTVTAIAFDAEQARHRVTGRAATDISPEGIAISPDGRFVVTGNLTRTPLPWNDTRLLSEGSLDLLQLDQKTGELVALQRVPIHGILPEGLAFDASGHYLAATVYDYFDPRRRRGAVEIFQLVRNKTPRLARTNVQIEVPPGPHSLWLVQ